MKYKDLQKWILEKHNCECCGKIMTEFYGSGRFCSKSCAHSRTHSKETKKKISEGKKNYTKAKIIEYNKNPKRCAICNKILPYAKRRRSTCSDKCYKQLLSLKGIDNGLRSAQSQKRRSKNEVEFANKCIKYFGKDAVVCNEPMFNNWDADIIIPHLKLAILWNGIWHYKQISKKQSLKQVQNRDKLKIKEIENYGYIPYVIKDMGKYSVEKVESEFDKLIKYVDNNFKM